MRTITVASFTLVFFIISIPLYLILLLIRFISPDMETKISHKIISKICRMTLALAGTKVTVLGIENVPKDNAVLYAFNHRSYFDILICYSTVPRPAGFVAKKGLAKNPFLNIWMKFLNGVFLEREDNRKVLEEILHCIYLIKNGHSLFIAPEGTINLNGDTDMYPFKEGSFRIAKKTGCPIIPVAINNADKIFERHLPWVRSTHVIIEYGKPVYLNDLNRQEMKSIGAHVQKIVREMLEKNHLIGSD